MYSYLNTKYGLKPLITRDVDACLDAVRRFSAEDNDVATFGAILRNEVDEPFRLVQRKLKETVRALLTAHLKGKHPHKSDAQAASALLAKTRGAVQEEEWRDVVLYMYSPEDAALLLSRLAQKAAALAADSPPRGAAGGGARPCRSAPRSRRESDGEPGGHCRTRRCCRCCSIFSSMATASSWSTLSSSSAPSTPLAAECSMRMRSAC